MQLFEFRSVFWQRLLKKDFYIEVQFLSFSHSPVMPDILSMALEQYIHFTDKENSMVGENTNCVVNNQLLLFVQLMLQFLWQILKNTLSQWDLPLLKHALDIWGDFPLPFFQGLYNHFINVLYNMHIWLLNPQSYLTCFDASFEGWHASFLDCTFGLKCTCTHVQRVLHK